MKCEHPYVKGPHAFACGLCLPCRIKRRSEWTHRLMLEATQHKNSAFVTLTYADDNLTFVRGLATLVPADLRDWLKRLRFQLPPKSLRFYAVGEYGDGNQRPHYHVALFGYPHCLRGSTRKDYLADGNACCSPCNLIHNTWGLGGVDVGTLTSSSARYVAGYIEKKLTRFDDPRLNGRHPEFSRMSNQNGGIGLGAMHDVASSFLQFNLEKREADVPSALRSGKSTYLPLGKYLRKNLRKMVGFDENTPPEILAEYEAEVQALYDAAFNLTKAERGYKTVLQKVRSDLVEKYQSSSASVVQKSAIFKQRRSL